MMAWGWCEQAEDAGARDRPGHRHDVTSCRSYAAQCPTVPVPRVPLLAPEERSSALRRGEAAPYGAVRSAGMTMSRFWILPVRPLDIASMIHTCRGYLYAATWPLT